MESETGRPGNDVPANVTRRSLNAMLLTLVVATAISIGPARAQSAEPAFHTIDFDWADS